MSSITNSVGTEETAARTAAPITDVSVSTASAAVAALLDRRLQASH